MCCVERPVPMCCDGKVDFWKLSIKYLDKNGPKNIWLNFPLCRSRSILKIGSSRTVSLEPWSRGRFLLLLGRRRWTFFILFSLDLLLSSSSRRTSFFPKEKSMRVKISVTTGSFLSQQTLWMRQSHTMETNLSPRYVHVKGTFVYLFISIYLKILNPVRVSIICSNPRLLATWYIYTYI